MAGKKIRSGILAGCGIVAAVAAIGGESAQGATLYTTGFEVSDGFPTGNYLTGAGNPPAFTSKVTPDVANNVGSASIETYATAFGSGSTTQLIAMSDSAGIATTTSAYYYPNLSLGYVPTVAQTPVIDIVGQIAVANGSGGVEYGLSAFDGTPAQTLVADVEVNAATGAVTVNGAAAAPGTSTGFTAPLSSTFYNYELQLNYNTQKYNVWVAPAGASAFTNEIATNIPFETAATTFSTAAIDTFSNGTTGSGVGFFDNLSITAVPEPTTASLVVAGLAVAGGRRRRRSSAR